jgi:hypothetical protein
MSTEAMASLRDIVHRELGTAADENGYPLDTWTADALADDLARCSPALDDRQGTKHMITVGHDEGDRQSFFFEGRINLDALAEAVDAVHVDHTRRLEAAIIQISDKPCAREIRGTP